MTPDEAEAALADLLSRLPPPRHGALRLYRVEATAPAAVSDWLREAWEASGAAQAEGRWFSESPAALGFYARDAAHAEPAVFYLDLDPAEAEPHRVGVTAERVAGRSPREFSADHDTEFFLPREVAAARLPGGLLSGALPGGPAPGPG